jgi:hypothetical protein
LYFILIRNNLIQSSIFPNLICDTNYDHRDIISRV